MVINTTIILEEDYDIAIVADCRFPNEYERWKEKGIDILSVRILRPDHKSKLTKEQLKHLSETALDDFDFDYDILNGFNLVALEAQLFGMAQNEDLI